MRTSGEIIADLLAQEVASSAGRLGVLVRFLPGMEAQPILSKLAAHAVEIDMRVAYLPEGGRRAIEVLGLDPDRFTSSIEQAEVWRNTAPAGELIVVVSTGDEPKLSSLEEFERISTAELKDRLYQVAVAGEAGHNAVQEAWWETIRGDERVGLRQAVEYYREIEGLEGKAFLEASSREVTRLGLLPDDRLFATARRSDMERRLAANRELHDRLQQFTPRDRRAIAHALDDEDNEEKRQALRIAMERLRRTRFGEEGIQVTIADAERLVAARAGSSTSAQKRDTQRLRELAIGVLLGEEPEGLLRAALDDLDRVLDDERLSASIRSGRRVQPVSLDTGTPLRATAAVPLEAAAFLSRLIDAERYGAVINSQAADVGDLVRRFEPDQVVGEWRPDGLRALLRQVGEPLSTRLAAAFDAFLAARRQVVPLMLPLSVDPLAVAADPGRRALLARMVEDYRTFLRTLNAAHVELAEATTSDDANFIVSQSLLIDLVAVRVSGRLMAILAPVHPLVVWHAVRFAELVTEQRSRLTEDVPLVRSAAASLPFFLASVHVPTDAFGESATLPFLDQAYGCLPVFGSPASAAAVGGVRIGEELIRTYAALEPHIREDLRLALVDPADPSEWLAMIDDLATEGVLRGATVTSFYHPDRQPTGQFAADEATLDGIGRRFAVTALPRRFTYVTRSLGPGERAPSSVDEQHIVLVVDPSPLHQVSAAYSHHPIHPLKATRLLEFRLRTQSVELVPRPGDIFADYFEAEAKLNSGPPVSHYEAHQRDDLRAQLTAAATRSPVFGVIDRQIDGDLGLGAVRIVSAVDRDRAVVGFARSFAPFRRPLRDVVRLYNTAVSDEALDGLLAELSDLLSAGVASLRPHRDPASDLVRVKGVVGTLLAARHLRSAGAESRIVVSLDGEDARRWLRLSPDPKRADLLAIDWIDDRVVVRIVEVKTTDSLSGELVLAEGVASGPSIDQLLATRRLLDSVFQKPSPDELLTTPARREVLREHLHRELAKSRYGGETRRLWPARLEHLLGGDVEPEIECVLAHVRLGVPSGSLAPERSVLARRDDETRVVRLWELNEVTLPAFVPRYEGADHAAGQPRSKAGVPGPVGDDAGEHGGSEVTLEPSHGLSSAPSIGTVVSEGVEQDRPRANVGAATGTYGSRIDAWYDPGLPGRELPNPHVAITGETGSGKTQLTKALIRELRLAGVVPLILDFKEDYARRDFAQSEGLHIYDPAAEPLPFNPLVPAVDPETGRASTTYHAHQLGLIIKRIYGLGDQQTYRLREALKLAYERAGVPTDARGFVPTANLHYPQFEEVRTQLAGDRDSASLLGRLSPIFDLGLFSGVPAGVAVDAMLAAPTVVRLGRLPGDEIKNAVAEFFLMAMYNDLIKRPQVHRLQRLLVLDEAWRLVGSPYLESLFREGRAFGLGIVVATQFPRDLPPEVMGSTATRIFFSQGQPDQIREIQRLLAGRTAGAEAEQVAAIVRALPPLSCLLVSAHHKPYARVAVVPYFERLQETLERLPPDDAQRTPA